VEKKRMHSSASLLLIPDVDGLKIALKRSIDFGTDRNRMRNIVVLPTSAIVKTKE